jgi:TonB family protein
MFDQLVESEPHGAEFKDRRRYFIVSSVVVGILFSTAVVISIFAANYDLGTGNFELVEMIAPDDMAPLDPEPPQPRPQIQNSSPSTSELPTRQVNMARVEESPTTVPNTVSTTQNTQLARPDTGRFRIGIDTLPDGPGGTESGRDKSISGPVGLSATDPSSRNPRLEEDTTPPPVVKPHVPKTQVSKGVLNGSAISLPKPNYSALAKTAGAAGQVNVQVTIDETGRVIAATAVTGHIMLRPDAERAARAARFSPTYLSSVPVKVTGVITYNFLK